MHECRHSLWNQAEIWQKTTSQASSFIHCTEDWRWTVRKTPRMSGRYVGDSLLSSQRHISGREGMEHTLLHQACRPESIPRQQEHGYQRQRKSIADSKQRIRGIDPLRLRSWDKVIEFNATLTLLVLKGRNIFKWAQISNMGEISRQSNLTHCVLALLIPWTRSFSVGGGDGWMCVVLSAIGFLAESFASTP